ncbi:hypothetical protein [Actinocorallia populi]|uniref:hypothetical protein n=1 Tax=Actinocorallia populi TaxID=2079200 RepID=UPI000D095097|nr:hypothetical protein [Actinocorallia populi]
MPERSSRTRSTLTASAVARRVAAALLTGVLTLGISSLAQGELSASAINLSVLLGGIVLLLQVIIDFERAINNVDQSIKDRFTRASDMARLLDAVGSSAVDGMLATELLENAAGISPAAPPLIKGISETEVVRASRFLRQLAHGEVVYDDGEDRDWLLSLTRNARFAIDATSTTTVDGQDAGFARGFWSNDLGNRYLRAQNDAVLNREVRIRRLFIVQDLEEFNEPQFASIIESQEKAGIHILPLQRDQVPPTLRPSLIDFILFDQVASYEVIPKPSPSPTPEFLNTRLITRPEHVVERRTCFEGLWNLATELRDQ